MLDHSHPSHHSHPSTVSVHLHRNRNHWGSPHQVHHLRQELFHKSGELEPLGQGLVTGAEELSGEILAFLDSNYLTSLKIDR